LSFSVFIFTKSRNFDFLMNVTSQIKQPILKEMELFEKKFYESMTSQVALLNRITYYIVNRKGKQMRPMFVFLTAKMVANGLVNERTYRGACVIELIHTATLVHDDVVDDSNRRRGFFSLNALWKNKIAVLVGDYLLSKGLLLSIDNGDFDLLRIISVAVREMSEGELLQIEKARRLDITEDIYYEIIRKKTATLIAACCALGACSVIENEEQVEKMRKFGELIGMAFQIKDDLFDYTDEAIGKPTGIDIKEQKMTLPLIHVLNTCTPKEKSWLINSIKNHNKDKKRVKEVIAFVKNNNGLVYAEAKMVAFQHEALLLLQDFPESDYKSALILMVNYVIERKK
jgi:octaprenyl-diphosphate synthase